MKATAITVWIGVPSSPMKFAIPTEAGCFPGVKMNVTANTYSFQAWKNAMTAVAAMDGAISGTLMRVSTVSGRAPSTRADSSSARGMPSIAPLRMRATIGRTKAELTRMRPPRESSRPNRRKSENSGTTMSASGSICVNSRSTVTTALPQNENRESA